MLPVIEQTVRRRGSWRCGRWALGGCLVATVPAVAQQPGADRPQAVAVGRVRGVVFDSLIGRPLAGAAITVPGLVGLATTDSTGNFVLASVPAGRVAITFSHPALDSVGLTSLGRIAHVAAGTETRLALGTPSLRTLYQRLCPRESPARAAPADSGIIFGIVADAESGQLLDGARVDVSWIALESLAGGRTRVTTPSVAAATDSVGAYRACGVPTGMHLVAQASGGPYSSGETDVTVSPLRPVVRHDLLAARNTRVPLATLLDPTTRPAPDDSAASGGPTVLRGTATVVGVVLDSLATPKRDAHVVVLGTIAAATTSETGRFRLSDLPAGSQTLEVRALGSMLERRTIDLRPGDTTWVDVMMRAGTTLPEVRVSARMPAGLDRAGFERRRRGSAGHYMTAAELHAIVDFRGVFGQMPGVRMGDERGVTTVQVRSGFSWCEPYVFIDGVRAHVDALIGNFRPEDLVAIEVYTRGFFAPPEFFVTERCGVIVAWSRAAKW